GATFVFPAVMGLSPDLAVMMSGVATILFLLIAAGKVPSYLGTSASFVAAAAAIRAQGGDSADVTGAILVAGLILVAAFSAAYAADGPWGELFGRAAGFLGTELYRDATRAGRFLTIDRWRNEQDWRSFRHAFGPAYEALDARLEGLAAAERPVFEGSC